MAAGTLSSGDKHQGQGGSWGRYDPFSKQTQPTASTRNTAPCAARSRRRKLRMLVRVLARQAARERFEREVAADREAEPEVTLH